MCFVVLVGSEKDDSNSDILLSSVEKVCWKSLLLGSSLFIMSMPFGFVSDALDPR